VVPGGSGGNAERRRSLSESGAPAEPERLSRSNSNSRVRGTRTLGPAAGSVMKIPLSKILSTLKNPLICKGKRAKKANVLQRFDRAMQRIDRQEPVQTDVQEADESRENSFEENPEIFLSKRQNYNEDDVQRESATNHYMTGDSECAVTTDSQQRLKKKRKAGPTRTNKFKKQENDDGSESIARNQDYRKKSEIADPSGPPASRSELQTEEVRSKKLTRAEKEAAACKVKESLPRYLRINTLLGMGFREVQKALLASGWVLVSVFLYPGMID
jgi:hypothetical protein